MISRRFTRGNRLDRGRDRRALRRRRPSLLKRGNPPVLARAASLRPPGRGRARPSFEQHTRGAPCPPSGERSGKICCHGSQAIDRWPSVIAAGIAAAARPGPSGGASREGPRGRKAPGIAGRLPSSVGDRPGPMALDIGPAGGRSNSRAGSNGSHWARSDPTICCVEPVGPSGRLMKACARMRIGPLWGARPSMPDPRSASRLAVLRGDLARDPFPAGRASNGIGRSPPAFCGAPPEATLLASQSLGT